MANTQKTVIVTGASRGIGAAVVKAFLERGYNVVGTSRSATKSAELKASDKLVLVDGDIGQPATAKKVADTAVQKFLGPVFSAPTPTGVSFDGVGVGFAGVARSQGSDPFADATRVS